jgi:hypothetical protein
MGWNAAVTNPSGVTLTVDPSNFTLPSGGTQQVSITADAGAAAFDNWLFGSVVFTPTGGGNGIQLRLFKCKIIYILCAPSLYYTICRL